MLSLITLDDRIKLLSNARLLEKNGAGTQFDILTAEVQFSNASQTLVTAQGTQKIARKNIAQLLSVDRNTEFIAADTVVELGTWDYSLEVGSCNFLTPIEP